MVHAAAGAFVGAAAEVQLFVEGFLSFGGTQAELDAPAGFELGLKPVYQPGDHFLADALPLIGRQNHHVRQLRLIAAVPKDAGHGNHLIAVLDTDEMSRVLQAVLHLFHGDGRPAHDVAKAHKIFRGNGVGIGKVHAGPP
ncbi:MAG: hypothetical protein E7319_06910 [Clostridiales bacterium]|nr:hypothetical protein [Clostridiales bacterium]